MKPDSDSSTDAGIFFLSCGPRRLINRPALGWFYNATVILNQYEFDIFTERFKDDSRLSSKLGGLVPSRGKLSIFSLSLLL